MASSRTDRIITSLASFPEDKHLYVGLLPAATTIALERCGLQNRVNSLCVYVSATQKCNQFHDGFNARYQQVFLIGSELLKQEETQESASTST